MIQRYDLSGELYAADGGEWCAYADHVAAVVDAQNEVRNEIQQRINSMPTVAWNEEWYARGKRDERARIKQAVMHMPNPIDSMDLLSIIDGEETK